MTQETKKEPCGREGCTEPAEPPAPDHGYTLCKTHLAEVLESRRLIQVDRDNSREYAKIPRETIRHIRGYADHGGDLPGFFRPLMENNLVDAVLQSDEANAAALYQIAKYIFNEIPLDAWGSPKKVRAWLKMKRAKRPKETRP